MLRAAFAPLFSTGRSVRTMALTMLLMLIPIAGPIWLFGIGFEHMRMMAWGAATELPQAGPAEKRLLDGLQAYGITLVWSLPASFLIGIAFAVAWIPLTLGPLSNPAIANSTPGALDSLLLGTMLPTFGGLTVLMWALSLLIIPFSYAALARASIYQQMSEGFRLGEIWHSVVDHARESWTALGWTAVLGAASMLSYLAILAIALLPLVHAATSGGPSAASVGLTMILVAVLGLAYYAWTVIQMFVTFGLWGEWARRVYRLQLPAT